ncbi:copper amine oxidase N-terminal domain-containing protein [Paenibacillus aceti]|uniref:asparaginase n=1 Tax=Paenibacillus aceti TaxID=1820010 RepID=A0ABQ1VS18_9BACL|nr:copper amine oxidase N-terminal domain-containing protein [Paenibacillus aceti]GGF93315.1 hypothetical protein GCM10010913_13600 [Paenibacillus aceti]
MKRVILLGLILLLFTGGTVASAAPSTYRVLVNGYIVTDNTLTQSGTTLVPFKIIFKELGYEVTYKAAAKTVQADKEGTSITLTVGSTKALVNGKETKLPVAPKSVNGVTYVPLRFVANVSGAKVAYDNGRNAIQIGDQIAWTQLDKPSFQNAKWGMTIDQVKKSETTPLLEEGTKRPYLHYQKTKFAGFDANAIYLFSSQRTLDQGGFFIQSSSGNNYVQDYRTLTAYLTKQYGEPTFETLEIYKEMNVDYTDEEWNQLAYSDDEFAFVAKWRTVDSEVMLIVKPNLQEISDIQISYESWWEL